MHNDKFHGLATAEAWEGRNMARAGVSLFLSTASESHGPDENHPIVEFGKFRIAPGYLVVGLEAVLIREPLNPEGRSAAIAHADRLARDANACGVFDEHYLIDSVEFDVFVYEHDGTRPKLIHEAPMQEDRK